MWLFKQNPSSAFCLTGALFPTHLDNEVVIDKELVGIFYFLCSFLKLGKEWRTATLKNFQPTFCQIEVIVLRSKVCSLSLFTQCFTEIKLFICSLLLFFRPFFNFYLIKLEMYNCLSTNLKNKPIEAFCQFQVFFFNLRFLIIVSMFLHRWICRTDLVKLWSRISEYVSCHWG